MNYEHQEYPKHLYHPEHGMRAVEDAAAHDKLGEDWYESPADFPSDAPAAAAPAVAGDEPATPPAKPKRKR